MLTKFKVALLIGNAAIIVGLIVAVLWLRGNNAQIAGERDLAVIERNSAIETNKENTKTIEAFRQQRISNDEIAAAVAMRLNSNRARTEAARRKLREAQANDPNVSNWASQPVPSKLRDTVEAAPGN